jgi:hypothetical protein
LSAVKIIGIASVIDEEMSSEKWWNDTDRGKRKYSEKTLAHCKFEHHKSHMYLPGTEPGSSW